MINRPPEARLCCLNAPVGNHRPQGHAGFDPWGRHALYDRATEGVDLLAGQTERLRHFGRYRNGGGRGEPLRYTMCDDLLELVGERCASTIGLR